MKHSVKKNKASVKKVKKNKASVKNIKHEAFDETGASRKTRYGKGFYLSLIQIWGEEDPGFYETFQP